MISGPLNQVFITQIESSGVLMVRCLDEMVDGCALGAVLGSDDGCALGALSSLRHCCGLLLVHRLQCHS